MICGWEKRDDYWTNINFPDFGQCLKYRGYLEIHEPDLRLRRTQKKQFADAVVQLIAYTTTRKCSRHGICPVGMPAYIWKQRSGESSARSVAR